MSSQGSWKQGDWLFGVGRFWVYPTTPDLGQAFRKVLRQLCLLLVVAPRSLSPRWRDSLGTDRLLAPLAVGVRPRRD